MKERIRVDQNVVEAKGFTNSSSLEIEITEPEGQRFPPPQKKEGARGEDHRESRGGRLDQRRNLSQSTSISS